MAVLYPRHFIGERFMKILAKSDISVDVAKIHGNRVETERDAVRLLSMHNAKGLEFPCVAIGGLGELKKPEDDVRLTYVAICKMAAELMPCSRQSSGTGLPPSACLRIAIV